jgi:hypothetical protein
VNEAAPIFVAGLDHSGKTTLRVALGAHPSIHMVRHIELWTRLRRWHAAGSSGRRRALDALTTGRAARLGLDREALDRSGNDFTALVREIGRQLCEAAGTTRWGLQEAFLEFQAAHVMREMPDARIVHLVRDPRDRYHEMRMTGAVGRGGLAAETAAWIASARVARAAAEARPNAFRLIRYEAFTDEREATLREICAFIDEPYADAMHRGEPASHEMGRLPDGDIAFIQDRAEQEMAAMGYGLLPVAQRNGALGQRVADASRWQLGQLSWRLRARQVAPAFALKRG